MSVPPRFVPVWLAATMLVVSGARHPAHAQLAPPVGPFVVDARGALASYPGGDDIASPRGLTAADLPPRGFGIQLGGHVYPWRGRTLTLGIGGSLLWTKGSQTPEPAADGTTAGTGATSRLTAFSPQVSLNFGTGRGWSYVSGGFGAAKRSVSSAAATTDEPGAWATSLDVGGGARWFFADHVGLGFDVRWLMISAQDAGTATAGFPGTTKFTAAAGLSFR